MSRKEQIKYLIESIYILENQLEIEDMKVFINDDQFFVNYATFSCIKNDIKATLTNNYKKLIQLTCERIDELGAMK